MYAYGQQVKMLVGMASPPRSRALADYHRLESLVCDISLHNGSSYEWDWLLNSGNAFTMKHLLPLLTNLDDRGLDIPSVLCPLCNDVPESVNHLFLHCSFVELLPPRLQNIFQGVCLITLWSVWKWRNKVAHSTIESKSKEQGADIFSMIQANSLLWISNRWSRKNVIPN
ncbi:RNA-directed DNA polymerase, eukaryota, reverse transcriptase zinc-binding domain protein [Tanacetum coccineum]